VQGEKKIFFVLFVSFVTFVVTAAGCRKQITQPVAAKKKARARPKPKRALI